MLVRDFLEKSARLSPKKTAIVCGGDGLTYEEVNARADRLANALVCLGIKRDDRVAVFLDNSVEAVVGIFAVLKANATFVVVNPTTKSEKLAYILNNCRVSGLMADWKKFSVVSPIPETAASLKFVIFSGKREKRQPP